MWIFRIDLKFLLRFPMERSFCPKCHGNSSLPFWGQESSRKDNKFLDSYGVSVSLGIRLWSPLPQRWENVRSGMGWAHPGANRVSQWHSQEKIGILPLNLESASKVWILPLKPWILPPKSGSYLQIPKPTAKPWIPPLKLWILPPNPGSYLQILDLTPQTLDPTSKPLFLPLNPWILPPNHCCSIISSALLFIDHGSAGSGLDLQFLRSPEDPYGSTFAPAHAGPINCQL